MKGPRILIADDDTKMLKMLAMNFRNAGYEVMCAQDGYQALQTARREKPDLMLLDVNMPAGDGFSVPERLVKLPDVATIPVIYLTGERSPRVANGAAHTGAYTVVHKPFEMEELLQEAAAALQEQEDWDEWNTWEE